MELIIIDEKKMKIMLTAPDMRHYELRAERMDCADEHTRRAFRHIFDDARLQTGFDTAGERLFVQLFTSKGGGCEIFVTKLGERYSDDSSVDAEIAPPSLSAAEQELLERVRTTAPTNPAPKEASDMAIPPKSNRATPPALTCTQTMTFVFPALDPLLCVCRRLSGMDYWHTSAVYIEEKNGQELWYLQIEVPDIPLCRLPAHFAFIAEYGREMSLLSGEIALYLGEYCRLICAGDAVRILGRL